MDIHQQLLDDGEESAAAFLHGAGPYDRQAPSSRRAGRNSTGSGGPSSSRGDEGIISRLDQLCEKDKFVKLPQEVFRRVKGHHEEFVRNAMRMTKTKARIDKIQKNITHLAQDQIPTGMPPFKQSFECPELDQAVSSNALDAAFHVPAGATFRKARYQLYMWFLAEDLKLQQLLNEKQKERLRSVTAFQTFLDSCVGMSADRSQAIADLGFDLPPGLFPSVENDIIKIATDLYKNTLESMGAQLLRRKAGEDKNLEDKDKFIAKMALRDPKQRFGDAVEQTLLERGLVAKAKSKYSRLPFKTNAHGIMMSNLGDDNEEDAKTAILENTTFNPTSSSSSKNGGPPLPIQQGKGNGQNHTAGGGKGKGKGKGNNTTPAPKAKAKAKAKAKSKQKPQEEETKGKSKGKGKEKGKGKGGKKGDTSVSKGGGKNSSQQKGKNRNRW